MTPEEKIEALREFFDNVDGNIEELKQGAWWDGFYWTRQKVLNITDPPRAKWREMVDAAKSVRHWLPGNELAVTLYHLSELANSPDDSHQLACIVAMCEDKVGDGWEADPDRVPEAELVALRVHHCHGLGPALAHAAPPSVSDLSHAAARSPSTCQAGGSWDSGTSSHEIPQWPTAEAAIQRVRELHGRHDPNCPYGEDCAGAGLCLACREEYPCATIRALDGLEGRIDD